MSHDIEPIEIELERPEDYLSPKQRFDAITDILSIMIYRAMQEEEKLLDENADTSEDL
jgi:hypothetical protein